MLDPLVLIRIAIVSFFFIECTKLLFTQNVHSKYRFYLTEVKIVDFQHPEITRLQLVQASIHFIYSLRGSERNKIRKKKILKINIHARKGENEYVTLGNFHTKVIIRTLASFLNETFKVKLRLNL